MAPELTLLLNCQKLSVDVSRHYRKKSGLDMGYTPYSILHTPLSHLISEAPVPAEKRAKYLIKAQNIGNLIKINEHRRPYVHPLFLDANFF